MAESGFKYVRLASRLGGCAAACEELPCSPAIYAWFRGVRLVSEAEPDEFIRSVVDVVGAPASPTRTARLGHLHEVSLSSRSQLSPKKLDRLHQLATSSSFRAQVAELVEHATAIQTPLYVGKATDIQARTRQHLHPTSQLATRLREADIDLSECTLGYAVLEETDDDVSTEDLTLLEEILTRVCRPGFVLRPG